MDLKLLDLIAEGSAELLAIRDGKHIVKDPDTGKTYEWVDGPVKELKPNQAPTPSPVADMVNAVATSPAAGAVSGVEKAMEVVKRRGLAGLLNL